jgi:acyl carrier protein
VKYDVSTEEALKNLIIENADVELEYNQIAPGKDLINDFGYNSIGMILLIIELEVSFNISLESDDIDIVQLSNYEYLCNTIKNLIKY